MILFSDLSVWLFNVFVGIRILVEISDTVKNISADNLETKGLDGIRRVLWAILISD